jgi:hypothetical protein
MAFLHDFTSCVALPCAREDGKEKVPATKFNEDERTSEMHRSSIVFTVIALTYPA